SRVPRTPRVMVPVQLDALVVRSAGATWADCTMSPPPAGDGRGPRLSLLPPPFKDLTASRPKGVYLHWAVPDALTRASAPDPSTPAQFPAIPDRWMVIRMFPSAQLAPRRAIRGWVIRTGEKTPVVVDLDAW